MGISSLGLASGIDSGTIIDQLVALEQQRVTKVENSIKTDQVKIDAYSSLRGLLSTLKTATKALAETSSFDLFKASSTNETAVTVKGASGAVDGRYDVSVYQLAGNEKMISTNGLITSQTASLSSQGISAGTFTVDGVGIELDSDDTIQDLRSKINSAKDSSGKSIGVSASVVQMSNNNFRLVLNAKESGSEGVAYTGSVLQSLGIITDAAGSKGNTNQTLQSAGNINTAFSGLAASGTIQFAGTDHNGNKVSGLFVKTSTSTIDDFLSNIEKSYNGTVDASIDSATGSLVLTDKISGSSKLTLTSLTTGADTQTVNISVAGKEGAGVLTSGKDSYFSIENILMSNSSNTVDKVFSGVTFDLKAISTDNVGLSLERDNDAIKEKVQAVVDAYNQLYSFIDSATSFADPDDEESSNGSLAGDSIASSIAGTIRAQLKQNVDVFGTSGKYTNLTMFGLKTDVSTGELSIDDDMFEKGLTQHYDDLVNLFTKIGTSNSSSVTMGRTTSDTKSGVYELEEVDSTHVRIRLSGSSDWYTSDTRTGDIVTFSDGPAKGLSLTAAAGSVTAGTTFTFSKGLGGLLDETIDKLTATSNGTVTMRTQSIDKGIDRKNERIEKLEKQIERYRERLVKQYTAMEKALSSLNSQTTSLVTSLNKSSSD